MDASNSTPSTRRGPGRLKYAAPSGDGTERFSLARGTRCVPAARHRDHDLGAGRDYVVPADLTRARACGAEDVFPARDPHLLRHPVTGVEQRVEPLEACDPRTRLARDSLGD